MFSAQTDEHLDVPANLLVALSRKLRILQSRESLIDRRNGTVVHERRDKSPERIDYGSLVKAHVDEWDGRVIGKDVVEHVKESIARCLLLDITAGSRKRICKAAEDLEPIDAN